jgi:hypothetical protein
MTTFPIRFTTSTSVIVLGSFAILGVAGSVAQAQSARSQYSAGRTTGGPQGGILPFASTYRRPSMSPYYNLQQQAVNPVQNQNVYQTMVQPQLQQQQQELEQIAQRRQMQKLQNQVQQIGRDTSSRQVDESIRATGHRATYMNYSHYYQ